MKKHAPYVIVLVCLWLHSATARADAKSFVVVDRIVAVVGRDAILLSQVDKLAAVQNSEQAVNAENRERTLDVLIDRMLLARAAAKADIVIDDAQVDAAIASVLKENNLKEEDLAGVLEQQGEYTMASYRENVAAEILLFKVSNHFVRPSLVIADAAIRARYQEIAKEGKGFRSLADVRDKIYNQLVDEGLEVKTKAWIKALRSEVIIDVRL